jgi:hypothetical protein
MTKLEPTPEYAHIQNRNLQTLPASTRKQEAVMKRRRSVSHSFEENIAAEKVKLEAQIAQLKPGPEMEALRRKIRQLDTAPHMSDWLSSSGLQAPQ